MTHDDTWFKNIARWIWRSESLQQGTYRSHTRRLFGLPLIRAIKGPYGTKIILGGMDIGLKLIGRPFGNRHNHQFHLLNQTVINALEPHPMRLVMATLTIPNTPMGQELLREARALVARGWQVIFLLGEKERAPEGFPTLYIDWEAENVGRSVQTFLREVAPALVEFELFDREDWIDELPFGTVKDIKTGLRIGSDYRASPECLARVGYVISHQDETWTRHAIARTTLWLPATSWLASDRLGMAERLSALETLTATVSHEAPDTVWICPSALTPETLPLFLGLLRALKQKGVTLWVSGAPSVALTKLLRRWDLEEVVKAGPGATLEEMLARAPEAPLVVLPEEIPSMAPWGRALFVMGWGVHGRGEACYAPTLASSTVAVDGLFATEEAIESLWRGQYQPSSWAQLEASTKARLEKEGAWETYWQYSTKERAAQFNVARVVALYHGESETLDRYEALLNLTLAQTLQSANRHRAQPTRRAG